MGSSMDSRYYVCPHCFRQFDWNDGSAQSHDSIACGKREQARRSNDKPIKASKKPNKTSNT